MSEILDKELHEAAAHRVARAALAQRQAKKLCEGPNLIVDPVGILMTENKNLAEALDAYERLRAKRASCEDGAGEGEDE